ncbi:hypothetical protein, partial [Streptomyces sp. NPDC047046]|uniref:hypothetical protein n=1 Tax=Streptomyces sp. NPDC047046 TaxID=3155378 RepID=UPI0034100F31
MDDVRVRSSQSPVLRNAFGDEGGVGGVGRVPELAGDGFGHSGCFRELLQPPDLRTRVSDLAGLYDSNLYGPEEKGCSPYLDLVS